MRVAIGAALALGGLTLPALSQQPAPATVPVGIVLAERKPIARTADFVGRVEAVNRCWAWRGLAFGGRALIQIKTPDKSTSILVNARF